MGRHMIARHDRATGELVQIEPDRDLCNLVYQEAKMIADEMTRDDSRYFFRPTTR